MKAETAVITGLCADCFARVDLKDRIIDAIKNFYPDLKVMPTTEQ